MVEGFGYKAKIIDGHSINELSRSIVRREKDRPLLIIAKTTVEQFPFLIGQDAHYYTMTEKDYLLAGSMLI
jgi:transketolase